MVRWPSVIPAVILANVANAATGAFRQPAAAPAPMVADSSKLAAVSEVLSMLKDVKMQVLFEGDKEAAAYNKFACWCKDTAAAKSAAIKAGTDEKVALTANIQRYSTERASLDAALAAAQEAMQRTAAQLMAARDERRTARKEYEKTEVELSAAIRALEKATEALKAANSLLQLDSNTQDEVRQAVLLGEALGIGAGGSVTSSLLQQAPGVPMKNYDFHSNDIVSTLEKLRTNFAGMKEEVDAEESKSKHAFDMMVQELTDFQKTKTLEVEETQAEKAHKQQGIASKTAELTAVSSVLDADTAYLQEANKMCSERAETWDQRSHLRAEEVSTLSAAIRIIEDSVKSKTSAATVRLMQRGDSINAARPLNDEALEAIEEEAEAQDSAVGPASFLQLSRSLRGKANSPAAAAAAQQVVEAFLRNRGSELRSPMLVSLATQLAGSTDPFAKVKFLIQQLLEKLLNEANEEANQKGWCDSATAAAKQKRDTAARSVTELNAEMAELEATRDKLAEELADITVDIQKLESDRAETQSMYDEESLENNVTIREAQAGMRAVDEATAIMKKFYSTAAGATVSFTQQTQSPVEDAPDTGFTSGEAYTGSKEALVELLACCR
mmetsp:Transcript_23179/g.53314  ORF Transcript_23179/g.53314 Transcript_23179/m.53314 type:complete len:613 (+) Transcript_23179:58-1896(+)